VPKQALQLSFALGFKHATNLERVTRDELLNALGPLLGERLTIARRAASMRGFHFGDIVEHDDGSTGVFALHLQCPWRIDGPDGTVTGSDDLWVHAAMSKPPDEWSYEDGDSLQDRRLAELLGTYDARTRSWVNAAERLVVTSVDGSDHGDVVIVLTGGYTLRVFPARSRDESWRLFRPRVEDAHVVFGAAEA
jgi:hypothetical protein